MGDAYAINSRNRLRRRHERGHYDHETINAILDGSYGLPHRLRHRRPALLHTHILLARGGSALLARLLRRPHRPAHRRKAFPVCLTVTHFDAIVLARSGFHHSVNYRCVMAYGLGARGHRYEGETRRDGLFHRSFLSRARQGDPPAHRAGDQGDHHPGDGDRLCRRESPSTGARIDEEDYAGVPVWCAVHPCAPSWAARGMSAPAPGVTPEAGGMSAYQ